LLVLGYTASEVLDLELKVNVVILLLRPGFVFILEVVRTRLGNYLVEHNVHFYLGIVVRELERVRQEVDDDLHVPACIPSDLLEQHCLHIAQFRLLQRDLLPVRLMLNDLKGALNHLRQTKELFTEVES